ncbi:S-norcoclaurine synthase 1-like [Telopea speciosissima]|uniref:S-norcoclaurine synthase 1-like n=1 Tax=Telopea speciosissima TaxID=54955 RepID=UPI001CC7BEDD|nr:S-norcoclaurine synthase 1-like [Telopea speciosissima]
MRGRLSYELDVGASAEEVWKIYSSPELPTILAKIYPGVTEKIEMNGNGGAGTTIHIVLAQGLPEPRSWKEVFVKIDNQERLRVVKQIEGGYLDMGFDSFEYYFKIIEKDEHSCIIRSTMAFEIDDKLEGKAFLVNGNLMWGMAKAIASYVVENVGKT